MREKDETLGPFPKLIDIELTNRCNYTCVMCPTGQGRVERAKGDMSEHTLLKVLDEAADHGTAIRYIRWGEPMLSPLLDTAIIETRQRGLICHINTNGSLLDTEWAHFFVFSGLDSIKFSFQGVDERTYRLMRNSVGYRDLLSKIKMLHDFREHMRADNPFIQIGTTVTTEPDSVIETFKAEVDSICDALYIGKTRDLRVETPSSSYCECPEVFNKLSVNWDGSVTACCGDYDNFMLIGNLESQSLEEIWNGKPLQEIRQKLIEYRHGDYYLCSRCARSLL